MRLSVVYVLAVGLDLSVPLDLTQCTWAFVLGIRIFDKWRCTESKVRGRRDSRMAGEFGGKQSIHLAANLSSSAECTSVDIAPLNAY
jgi:hypothetical protein